jgi:hypothetical protein
MTTEKANLPKKISFSPKKVLISTSRIPLAVGASCVTFSATRGEPTPFTLTFVAEKSLIRPLPLREIQALKKVVLFFFKEIVFVIGLSKKTIAKDVCLSPSKLRRKLNDSLYRH